MIEKQIVEIKIDSVGRRGDGVGQWQGRPVFVPRALPGEIVRVRLEEARDKGIAARLLEVVTPAPGRIAAPCPHYDRCGGCSLQHWDDAGYRDWKVGRLPLLLERAGIAVNEWLPPVFIPESTRRRATFAAVKNGKSVRLGYHRGRSHEIVDLPDCMVLTPRLQAVMQGMRARLPDILAERQPVDIFVQDTGLALDAMFTGPVGAKAAPDLGALEGMAALAQGCGLSRLSWRARERDTAEVIVQPGPVAKAAGSLRVDLPPGSFMQPSAEGEAALVAAALAPVRAERAKKTADLFAGCGTFAGPLLALGSVRAVEMEGAAIAALNKAAKGTQLTAEARNLYSDPLPAKELDKFDAVLFDPPRMGAKEQAAEMARSSVPLIVGISCNPTTFVRDAGILQAGGYKLESMRVIDQFVWSAHLELVGIFRRG